MKSLKPEYLDDYPVCKSTYATLCIYPSGDAEEVSRTLGIEPSEVRTPSKTTRSRSTPITCWFLSTKGTVESKDLRRHVDWLLDQLAPRKRELNLVRSQGAECEINCYWRSAYGHGGPGLSPSQSKRLGALELSIWLDIYFDDAPPKGHG